MKHLEGAVAVITGAASGIGRGTAQAFAERGMRLVLADIEPAALHKVVAEFEAKGVSVVSSCVDVSDANAVDSLADFAYASFGQVNVVCNNAGVIENNLAIWEYSTDDWNWVLGINLMGVAHGIRSFVPRMIDGGEPGHVVNTASFGGLICGSATPIYIASKHAVVAMSESLYHDLKARGSKLNASVLCPGWVRTSIVESDRNRNNAPPLSEKLSRTRQRFQQGVNTGIDPHEVGAMVVDGIIEERFYLHTHPEWLDQVSARFDAIKDGKSPALCRIPNPKK
ncbi:MAG: SDR family NAD(P)-dependent oxidoreductase [Proteobacteria bacterium]|nr:SDR family NAD(P)-dependent oxidoreductase [Pseudomonadota bacterium]